MTFTVTILILTFAAAVWLAVDLLGPGWRVLIGQRARGGDPAGDVSYAPVARLLAEGDFAYLANETDLAQRLFEMRTATMRLYLKRIRRDYLEVWSICKLLAPISPDPAFTSKLSRQYWEFHWAYATIWVQCLVPAVGRHPSAADRLVRTITDIRERAHSLLAVSDTAMSAAPAAA